jgi:hypothetical protein
VFWHVQWRMSALRDDRCILLLVVDAGQGQGIIGLCVHRYDLNFGSCICGLGSLRMWGVLPRSWCRGCRI